MQKKIVTFLILVTVAVAVVAGGVVYTNKKPAAPAISLADSKAVALEMLSVFSIAQNFYYRSNKKQFASDIDGLSMTNVFLTADKEVVTDIKKAFSQKKIESFKGYFYKFLTTKDKSSFSILAFPEKGLSYPCYFLNETMLVYECDKKLVVEKCHDTKDIEIEKCKILLYVDK